MNSRFSFLPAGCSAIQLTSAEGNPCWARTCDLHESIAEKGAHLVSLPRNAEVSFSHGTQRLSHSYCGITFDRQDTWLLDGINDAGLAGGLLMLYEGTSLPPDPSCRGIMGMELVSAMLAACASVSEVLQQIADLAVLDIPYEGSSVSAAMHYYFLDPSGASVVLEAADPARPGRLTAYPNSIGVLTNSPPYPAQLSHLSWFLSASPELSAAGVRSLSFEHTEIAADSSAPHLTHSGTFPGSYASYDRFARAAVFKALNHCGRDFHDREMLPAAAGLMRPLFEPLTQGVFHYAHLDEENRPVGSKNSHTQYTVIYLPVEKTLFAQPFDALSWFRLSPGSSHEFRRYALFGTCAENFLPPPLL